jgi:uncharacterized protein (DUF4415 family)
MVITYDPAKRERTLRERGLGFEWAEEVFAGPAFDREDARRDYGESRIITVGYLRERMVVVVWTARGDGRHIISMRKPMSEKRRATAGRSKPTRSDLKKIDEYLLGRKDYEEIPELTDEWFRNATLRIGGVPVNRGRPNSTHRKQPVSLRLDPDVLMYFRRSGGGWQTRINAILRKAAKLPSMRPGARNTRLHIV